MTDNPAGTPEQESATTDQAEAAGGASVATEEATTSSNAPVESVPDFEPLQATTPRSTRNPEFSRFSGVHVKLIAELGRTELTLQSLLELSEGAVVELNRSITAPVELVAQGVPLGNGEVVVIDDQFAVRIKEIYPT